MHTESSRKQSRVAPGPTLTNRQPTEKQCYELISSNGPPNVTNSLRYLS